MSLIGNDFVEQPAPYSAVCGECRGSIQAGEISLVSIRNGVVKKRVCSEECRQTFDDRFWQGEADDREFG